MTDAEVITMCDLRITEHRAIISQFEQALEGDLDEKTRKKFEKVIRDSLQLIKQAEQIKTKTIKQTAGGGAGRKPMSHRPRKPARYCARRQEALRGV